VTTRASASGLSSPSTLAGMWSTTLLMVTGRVGGPQIEAHLFLAASVGSVTRPIATRRAGFLP
jgi:hypothetical protein